MRPPNQGRARSCDRQGNADCELPSAPGSQTAIPACGIPSDRQASEAALHKVLLCLRRIVAKPRQAFIEKAFAHASAFTGAALAQDRLRLAFPTEFCPRP